MIGAPTEGALVTLAHKGWAPDNSRDDWLAEIPFTSARKRMSVLAKNGDTARLHVKGAPEAVLECTTTILTGG